MTNLPQVFKKFKIIYRKFKIPLVYLLKCDYNRSIEYPWYIYGHIFL